LSVNIILYSDKPLWVSIQYKNNLYIAPSVNRLSHLILLLVKLMWQLVYTTN